MKTRKNAIMRNGALVAVLLVVATLVMGCSNSADGDSGSGGGGGGLVVPEEPLPFLFLTT